MLQIRKNISLLIVIIISLVAVFSLTNPGLPPTHDGEYHVIRFYEFDKVLRDGNLYPRWAPDLQFGYGVPLFNYVYPMPNYIASFIHSFNISFIDTFKLSLALSSVVGAVFFFLWTKYFWREEGAIFSAVVYSFTPYHFVDIFVRGSIGEVWALAFFPGFLWSITNLIYKNNRSYFLLSSLFLAFTILSHNILALMFFCFALVYIAFLVVSTKNKIVAARISLFTIALSLGLSAIFWLPAIAETKYVQGLQIYSIKENFPEIFQLLIPSWGTGFSGNSIEGQMSFQIGLINLFIVFLNVIFLPIFILKKQKWTGLIILMLISFFITLFLMTRQSEKVWEIIPLLNYFQFPWRLLSLEMIITSFLAGTLFSVFHMLKVRKILINIILIFLCLITILMTIGYAKTPYHLIREDEYYISRSNFIDGTNSPGNVFNTKWANNINKRPPQKITSENTTEIINLKQKSTDYEFIVKTNEPTKLKIHNMYFPGWKAYVNNKYQEIINDNQGIQNLYIEKGTNIVNVKLGLTNIQILATTITYCSMCIFLGIIFKSTIIKKL